MKYRKKQMDNQTKKLIANVLILIGIAAIGVILWDYGHYLMALKEHDHLLKYGTMREIAFSHRPQWYWSQREILQIIIGVISIGAGISLKKQS